VAALRGFALVDREMIVDERDASITTNAIRLHRLVREIAVGRRQSEARDDMRSAHIAALMQVYPKDGYNNQASRPRYAVLTPHLLASCETATAGLAANVDCADLLDRAGVYLLARAAYSEGRPLLECALAIREKVLGPEHSETAQSLNHLALLLTAWGEFVEARPI
jgi:hypothetical protein